MGAIMAIKHLAGRAETCEQAIKLFSMYIILHNLLFDYKFYIYKKEYTRVTLYSYVI